MASYDEILATLAPSDMDRRDALTQSLLMAAAQALQGGDSKGSVLGKTMFAGMTGYNAGLDRNRKERMDQFLSRKQAFELAQAEKALTDQKALAEAMRGAAGGSPAAPAAYPGGMTADEQGNAMPPVSARPAVASGAPREQQRQMLQSTIDRLIAQGAGHMVGPLQEKLAKLEDEWSPEVRYDQSGKGFMTSKQGGIKYLDGINARDEIVGDNLGDVERFRTKYSLAPLGTVARGQSPDSRASNAVAIRGQNMTDARSKESIAAMYGSKSREDADALRKEFAALPATKNFADVAPIFNAAANAPDTPAGDFALIYGVGKILDPGSVVREGEMNLVMKAGSPAQRIMGYLSYLKGNGRLTPPQRAELTDMLHNAVSERQTQYQQTRGTYEGLARERGYKPEDIFVGSPAIVERKTAPTGNTVEYGGKTYTFPSPAAAAGFRKQMGI